MTSNTKKHVIRQVSLSNGRTFLAPEIDTIDEFVDGVWFPELRDEPTNFGHQPYRGHRAVDPKRDYYLLQTLHVEGGPSQPLQVRARKPIGLMVAKHCTDKRIGRFQVIKGGWPDPYALLLAHDHWGLKSPLISLIDWEHYKRWLITNYAAERNGFEHRGVA